MRMAKSVLIALSLFGAVITLCTPSHAGIATTTGKEWRLWSEGDYSVVVARVVEIERAKGDNGDAGVYFATFEPIALLAGSLDPSLNPSIHVSMYVGNIGGGTSISDAPDKGSMVLAVVQHGNFVVSDICTFMPKNSAMVQITGLGDARIIETLKKLQDARAHADPDPHGPPATRRANTTKPKS